MWKLAALLLTLVACGTTPETSGADPGGGTSTCDVPRSCTKDGTTLAQCKCGGVDVRVACCVDGAVVVSPCMDGIHAGGYCNPIRIDTGVDTAVDTSIDAGAEAGDAEVGADGAGDGAGDGSGAKDD